MNKPVHPPARYLVLIDAGDGMVARLFDARHRPVIEIDASSSEVAEMTAGRVPAEGADPAEWGGVLGGHSEAQVRGARIYTLDP